MMQASINNSEIKTRDHFDEKAYIQHYDDIRQALKIGAIESAWWRYEHFGRAEGRKAFRLYTFLDEQFYVTPHPDVNTEVHAKMAASMQDHYLARDRVWLSARS